MTPEQKVERIKALGVEIIGMLADEQPDVGVMACLEAATKIVIAGMMANKLESSPRIALRGVIETAQMMVVAMGPE